MELILTADYFHVSWSSLIHSTPSYPSRVIWVLYYHLSLRLSSCLFPSRFLTKALYAFILYTMQATRPSHLCILYLIIRLIYGEEYKLWSSSLRNFLQPPVTFFFSDPNILLVTLFSKILNLCCSVNMRDQVSHPYKTRDSGLKGIMHAPI